MAVNTTKFPVHGARAHSSTARHHGAQQQASDDEILGLVTSVARPEGNFDEEEHGVSDSVASAADALGGAKNTSGAKNAGQAENESAPDNSAEADAKSADDSAPPAELAPILAAHPELQDAWDAAHAYRAAFPTPEAAHDARHQLDDLDAKFFSVQPADHSALAARIHELSPEAFHGLRQAMQSHADKMAAAAGAGENALESTVNAKPAESGSAKVAPQKNAVDPAEASTAPAASASNSSGANAAANSAASNHIAAKASLADADPRRAAQAAFFHSTNAAAVEKIIGAIHSQVEHLLPDSIPAGTRTRIVGEIYRELDSTLRANRQLGKQLREAFQSGAGDAGRQRAIVALVTGRARQALPAVAKRVIGEWTQTIVAANRERLGRHEAASKRVDIAGAAASDGANRKPLSPRDINYRKLSDADILNL